MSDFYDSDDALATISRDGEVPECRMKDAAAVQDWYRNLEQNDERRSFKRARLNGLCGGNPPYSASKLRQASRAEAANVNWGTARSFMENACGAFYDLFAEAPGFMTIETSHGNEEQRPAWSNVMSQEADYVLNDENDFSDDPSEWDYTMQRSIWGMVLHGNGPLLFEDCDVVMPRAANSGELKVPEFTKSTTKRWDACAVAVDYWPTELFDFIRDAESASKRGWNVEYTKSVISNAMDVKLQPGIRYDWEFFQRELKNNSLEYMSDGSKICRVVFAFWREFDGRITRAIVERESTTNSTQTPPGQAPEPVRYLYINVGEYKNWDEAIHPMYYDRGNEGDHHSVDGLGVKMYSAMEYQNRLICRLCDGAFAPKTLFKPTTAEATQRFQLATHGDWGLLPAGYDAVQNPISGLLTEGIELYELTSGLTESNLSQYRQQPQPKSGNPVTAKQAMMEAAQQAALSKTTFNRFYKQLSRLYAEIGRRLCNINSTDERAKRFQAACMKRGVPKECFGRIKRISAVRVIGQGSTFMRREAVNAMMPYFGSLPENGRENLMADKIAVECGQTAVQRYMPTGTTEKMASDQQVQASLQIAAMRTGMKPEISSNQNPEVFATMFLQAAQGALQSISKGADPSHVLQFEDICGPAIGAHLKRFANDPLRKPSFDKLMAGWKQLQGQVDQLRKMVQSNQQRQKAQQQVQQSAMSDQQFKAFKLKSDIQLRNQKQQAQLKQGAEKHRLAMASGIQKMQLKDAEVASDIHRQNRLAAFDSDES